MNNNNLVSIQLNWVLAWSPARTLSISNDVVVAYDGRLGSYRQIQTDPCDSNILGRVGSSWEKEEYLLRCRSLTGLVVWTDWVCSLSVTVRGRSRCVPGLTDVYIYIYILVYYAYSNRIGYNR